MNLKYTGKTKNVYELEDGNYLLKCKDDVTSVNGVFNPGANTVGLTMEGAGRSGLRLTKFFFEILKEKGIPTHYIDANIDMILNLNLEEPVQISKSSSSTKSPAETCVHTKMDNISKH